MGKTTLTRRELEVVRYVARGWNNREIAKELFLSEETIKSHVRHILSKLKARNRAHAVGIVAMNAPQVLR